MQEQQEQTQAHDPAQPADPASRLVPEEEAGTFGYPPPPELARTEPEPAESVPTRLGHLAQAQARPEFLD